jgi:hypothetical protein
MRICPLCLFDRCDDTATRCRQCGAGLTPVGEEASTSTISAAWFHYLRIPNIGTLELAPGTAFSLGRDPRSDLVLPKAKGAQIATIFWTDGYEEATVREMGAPEAVKVEGIRIKGTRTLKGGEEIEVGRLCMSYLKRATPVEDSIKPKKRSTGGRGGPNPGRAIATPTKRKANPYYEPKARKLKPKNERPPPVVVASPGQVARVLEKKRATGTLRVTSRQGRGWVTLMSGAPKFAAFGDLSADRALAAILRLPKARCQMIPGLPRRGSGKPIALTFSQALARLRPPQGKRPGPPRPGKKAPSRGPSRRPRR